MKVILLKAVPKLGKPNDIVEVNQGYAQNALFPQRLAIPATDKAIKDRDRKIQSVLDDKTVRHKLLDAVIKAIEGKLVTFPAKANEQGSLFSKIDANTIASFLETKRISLDPKCITVPEGHIKKIGVYTIHIKDENYQAIIELEVVKE